MNKHENSKATKLNWRSFVGQRFYSPGNSLEIALLISVLFLATIVSIVYSSISQTLNRLPGYLLYLFVFFIFFKLLQSPGNKIIKVSICLASLVASFIFINIYRFNIKTHLELAQGYLKGGNYNLAKQELESVIQHPGYFKKETISWVHFEMIWLYLNSRQWNEASEEAFKLWRLDRNNEIIKIGQDPKGNFYYGFCYEKKNELKEAKEKYLQAIKQFPANHTIYLRLAGISCTEGDYDQAISYCSEAIKLSPKNADYFYQLANSLVLKGDFAKGAEKYEETLALEPRRKNALVSLGNLYTNNVQNKENALIVAEKLIKLYPRDPGSHQLLARAFQMNSRYKEAMHEYEYAIRTNPKDDSLRKEFEDFKKAYLRLQ